MAKEQQSQITIPDFAHNVADTWREVGIHTSAKINDTLTSLRETQTRHTRRWLTKQLTSQRIFPTEITAYNNAIEEAHDFQEQGYAFIVPYNHSNYREPIDVMTTLISLGKGFENVPYLSPLAMHQRKPYIPLLSHATDIPVVDIVTKDTVARGKNIEKLSLPQKATTIFKRATHQEVPHQEKLPEGYGLRDYIDKGSDILSQGGIVFVAPQGGRRNTLGQPAGRAVEMLVRAAEKKGVDKIAVWPMGILLQDTEVFDESTAKFNFGKTADVQFGTPLTVGELRSLAQENSTDKAKINMDQQVFRELSGLLADAYTSPKNH